MIVSSDALERTPCWCRLAVIPFGVRRLLAVAGSSIALVQ